MGKSFFRKQLALPFSYIGVIFYLTGEEARHNG
jgi:hypothetical protein